MSKKVKAAVVNRLIECLEKGTNPWRKKWTGGLAPANVKTPDKPYKGINRILLGMSEYDTPFFATRKTIVESGGRIPTNLFRDRAEWIVLYKKIWSFDVNGKAKWVSTPEAAEKMSKTYTLINSWVAPAQYFHVWNVSLIEWEDGTTWRDHFKQASDILSKKEILQASKDDIDRLNAAEKLAKAFPNQSGVKLVHRGAKASYSPPQDRVQMPSPKKFESLDSYYTTLMHEFVHSTGHKSRLDREGITGITSFGSQTYGKEELIAEIGACMVGVEVGVEVDIDNSAAYLKSWAAAIKDWDTGEVFKAASAAEKASQFILDTLGNGTV